MSVNEERLALKQQLELNDTEVQQHLAAKEALRIALRSFTDAAIVLDRVWCNSSHFFGTGVENYPEWMPDFTEAVHEFLHMEVVSE